MKNKKLIFVIFAFIAIFAIFSLTLLSRSIIENDEGIYWATFLLVNKGYKLYKEISFSQLPGFFLAVYPIFKLFGSTIAAARLGVFFWSLVALFSIIWLGYVRKTLLFSLVSVVLLMAIPTFFNQSITLQSDIVAVSFSTISFVCMMTFVIYCSQRSSNNNYFWLILSSLFFSVAILTKFDYSLSLPFGFLFLMLKKNKISNIFLFFLISLVDIFVILNFFGINNIINNVLSLREKALKVYPFGLFKIFEYLKNDLLLFSLVLVYISLIFFKWKKDYFFYSLFFWFISSFFLVFSFRPLFYHHLVFLAVPSALLFTLNFTNTNASINRLIEAKVIIILIVAVFVFANNVVQLVKRQNSKSIKEREVAKNFILENTEENDVIITDEAALYGMTGRLPPPELVDLSYVQIRSGNISSQKFNLLIKKNKPKLIIAWNGRLNEIKNFANIVEDYEQIYLSDNRKNFFTIFVPANPEGL